MLTVETLLDHLRAHARMGLGELVKLVLVSSRHNSQLTGHQKYVDTKVDTAL
jgi:hypothetical protein